MFSFKIDIKLFFTLYVTFILFTVIGTLSHEMGHYTVAKMLGYESRINYMSTYYEEKDTAERALLMNFYKQHQNEIKNEFDFFVLREKYRALNKKYFREGFWITLGGPLQTMLTGTIGLILLIIFRKKFIHEDKIYPLGWALIFLSLFWLRQFANLFTGFVGYLMKGEKSMRSDETRLAYFLEINLWTIEVVTAIISVLVLFYVLIKIIPRNLVFTFLLAGLAGGISGYYLWLIKFGKYIMP